MFTKILNGIPVRLFVGWQLSGACWLKIAQRGRKLGKMYRSLSRNARQAEGSGSGTATIKRRVDVKPCADSVQSVRQAQLEHCQRFSLNVCRWPQRGQAASSKRSPFLLRKPDAFILF